MTVSFASLHFDHNYYLKATTLEPKSYSVLGWSNVCTKSEGTVSKEITSNPKSKLCRSLLASTCLTVACGATATAGTITEGTAPAPANFGNTFNTASLLPVGTTQVFGFLGPFDEGGGANLSDWFELQGLTPGATYLLDGSNQTESEGALKFSVFNSSDVQLSGPTSMEGGGFIPRDAVSIVAPLDGILVVNTTQIGPTGEEGGAVGQYEVALSTNQTSTVPEPSTMAGVGLAAAAMLAWRRRRSK